MYTRIITHGEQNVTMTSKVRGQGLRTNAVNSNISQTIIMSYIVDFDKYTNIISHGEQNVKIDPIDLVACINSTF